MTYLSALEEVEILEEEEEDPHQLTWSEVRSGVIPVETNFRVRTFFRNKTDEGRGLRKGPATKWAFNSGSIRVSKRATKYWTSNFGSISLLFSVSCSEFIVRSPLISILCWVREVLFTVYGS